MKFACRCVLALFLTVAVLPALVSPASANSKYAAYVVHADSGDVLFSRYATAQRYPASLTKMMTLYLLFEELESGNLTLESKLSISARAAGQPPSKLGLTPGETIDVETAIQALVVKSANDVAAVIAEHIGGSEWRFATMMTAKARSMGMTRTTFRNASGLPNSKQVTTAHDMSILGRRIIQDFPQYYDYFNAKSFAWNGRTYSSHNKLLKTFEGADGIKTGYTRRSGFNLVTTAKKDGERLIGVVLGGRSSRTRDAHMRDILSKAFDEISRQPTMIAALHRKKPSPRIKPTLLAQMAAASKATSVEANALPRSMLTASMNSIESLSPTTSADQLGALIAAADTDDFNEFERTRMASMDAIEGFIGEGDRQDLHEFSWAVQIGAYSTKKMAQDELESAATKSGLTERSRAVLPTPTLDGKMLYRARFMNLSEIEAATACATLKAAKVKCFTVSDAISAAH